MNTVKCPNCGIENKNTNIRCENCGTELNHIDPNSNFINNNYRQLDDNTIDKVTKKAKHISIGFLIIILAPWVIFGLIFIAVSMYSIISDNNKSNNYLKTEGKFVGTSYCTYDDDTELCKPIYEYEVNGKIYRGSPNSLSNHFKQKVTVKYNSDNPNEYVINSGWHTLLIAGIIMIIAVLLIYKYAKKKFR